MQTHDVASVSREAHASWVFFSRPGLYGCIVDYSKTKVDTLSYPCLSAVLQPHPQTNSLVVNEINNPQKFVPALRL